MRVERDLRATSFGAVADDYDRYRPAPPPEVADWFLPHGAKRVADICAGTGAFSRVLATRADEVVAVELDLRMLTLLSARSAGVFAARGRAEVLPIRESSLDAVTVSSAWHWLDPDLCLPEIARVLRPGGVLGVVWNGPGRHVKWVSELFGHDRVTVPSREGPRRALRIPDGQPFGEPEYQVMDWTLSRTPAELVGLAGTYSRVIALAPPERRAVARRAAELVERHLLPRDQARVELPMRARCWKSVRLDQAE